LPAHILPAPRHGRRIEADYQFIES